VPPVVVVGEVDPAGSPQAEVDTTSVRRTPRLTSGLSRRSAEVTCMIALNCQRVMGRTAARTLPVF
jgi:hypothetical protein